jgi:hypothetical protein
MRDRDEWWGGALKMALVTTIVSSRERKETVAAIRQLMRLRGSIVTDVRSGQAEGEP